MAIQLSSSFNLQTQHPLDERLVKAGLDLRDAIPFYQRYEGMMVYVEENGKNYQLIGGITNNCWQDVHKDREESNVYIGAQAPDKHYVWIDTSSETIGQHLPDFLQVFEEYREAIGTAHEEIKQLTEKVTDLTFLLTEALITVQTLSEKVEALEDTSLIAVGIEPSS